MSDPTQPPTSYLDVPAPGRPAGNGQLPAPGGYPPPLPQRPGYRPQSPSGRPEGGFRRGFGLGAGAGVGLGAAIGLAGLISAIVGALLLAGLGNSAAGLNTAAAQPLETIWGSPTAAHKLRAVYVTGPIMATAADGSALTGGSYGYEIAAMVDDLDAADADGLLLLMNTPGGSVNGSKAIADAVARYQQRTGKTVTAHVQGLSASGGMYAMAGADKIIADHGSLVGSIGVIYGPFNRFKDVTAITGTILEPGVVTTGGITQEYLTQGKGKDMGNPFRDMTAEERKVMTDGMAIIYGDFVDWVAQARGIPAATIVENLGAHVYDPETAIANGLIDAQLGVEEAYAEAARVAGVDPAQTRVETATAPSLLVQLLGAEARVFGQAVPLTGSDPKVTAAICSATPTLLVYHGSLKAACG